MNRIAFGAFLLIAAAAAAQPAAGNATRSHEVWIALRADRQPGSGSFADPYDGGTPEKLNALFGRFHSNAWENLVVHFGPGLFLGDRPWHPRNNWKIRGAGRDITILKTRDDPDGTATVGFCARCPPDHPWVSGFELSDMTVDFNVPNLRKADRTFVFFRGKTACVYYGYLGATPPAAWQPGRDYAHGAVVAAQNGAYIATQANRDVRPAQGLCWSRLQPNQPERLPAWNAAAGFAVGDAVAHGGQPWICAAAHTNSAPAAAGGPWRPVRANAPDPLLYTSAADIWSGYGGGRNEVRRVRMLNGHGSSFFGREAFLVKIGGDDCVIEDCQVEQFRGDYSTCLVVFGGHNNVIRGCTVDGAGGDMLFAYGGWENLDNVFENNYARNVRVVTNIDSLKSTNVIFRNNVFMGCRQAGIGINVGSGNSMDGLFIHDNFIQMQDDAELAGIQLGQDGLSNVRIAGNIIRTVSGRGAARPIAVASNARHVTIRGNTCEPGMAACQVPPHAFCVDNHDLQGRPMKGLPRADRGAVPTLLTPAAEPQPADPAAPALAAALGPEGEIRDWLVLGPFPHPPEAQPEGVSLGAGYGFDFLATVGGEGGVKPRAGDSVLVRFPEGPDAAALWPPALLTPFRAAWVRVKADERGHVEAGDIPAFKAALDTTCLYAFCILRAPDNRAVHLKLGSDDGYVLFVNGRKAGEVRDDRRGYRRDQNSHAVELQAGDNPVLLKVCNYWGGFGWGVRVTAADGQASSGLEVKLP